MKRPKITTAAHTYALCRILAVCALISSAAGFAGCAKPEKFQAIEHICLPDLTRAEAMTAAEDVLGRMYFTIDKADTELGIIRTRPLAGAQFFEFWRKDNAGPFNSHEANLHTIRRTARIDINPVRDPTEEVSNEVNQLCFTCSVRTQRLSLPARPLTSSSQAFEMFSRSGPTMQRFELHPEHREAVSWIDLGRDARLETEILNRLNKKLKLLSYR